MGIIYQVKIRCFKVKNIDKVDLTVWSEHIEEDGQAYKKKIQNYIDESKKNIETVLAVYDHDPCHKRDYTLTKVLVPEGTNVLAFGNDACDRYGGFRYYEIDFFDKDGEIVIKHKIRTTSERNNFMVIVPPNTFSLNYIIGDYVTHSFGFGPHCLYCNNETDTEEEKETDDSGYDSE